MITSNTWLRNKSLTVESPDQVLCTLPFTVLRHLALHGLDAAKVRAIRNMEYASSTKVLLHCKQRFWELAPSSIAGGRSISDRIARQTYYPSDNAPSPAVQALGASGSPGTFPSVLSLGPLDGGSVDALNGAADPEVSRGPGVLLASYSWNHNARHLGLEGPEEMVEHVITDLSVIHEQVRGYVDGSATMFWDRNPSRAAASRSRRRGTSRSTSRQVGVPAGTCTSRASTCRSGRAGCRVRWSRGSGRRGTCSPRPLRIHRRSTNKATSSPRRPCGSVA